MLETKLVLHFQAKLMLIVMLIVEHGRIHPSPMPALCSYCVAVCLVWSELKLLVLLDWMNNLMFLSSNGLWLLWWNCQMNMDYCVFFCEMKYLFGMHPLETVCVIRILVYRKKILYCSHFLYFKIFVWLMASMHSWQVQDHPAETILMATFFPDGVVFLTVCCSRHTCLNIRDGMSSWRRCLTGDNVGYVRFRG